MSFPECGRATSDYDGNAVNDPRSIVALRPLGVGEILDRAVTLYVRYWAPLLAVSCVLAVPTAVFQFVELAYYQTILAAKSTAVNLSSAQLTAFFLIAIVVLLLEPFVYVAACAVVGQMYRSEPVNWRRAYGTAARHGLGILLCIATGIGVYFAVVFALTMFFIGGFALASPGRGASPGIVFVIFAVLVFVALGYVVLLMFFAIAMALTAIGAEDVRAPSALTSSFKSVLSRSELGKATLVLLSMIAVTFGIAIVNSGVQMLLINFHLQLVSAAMPAWFHSWSSALALSHSRYIISTFACAATVWTCKPRWSR